MRQSRAAHCKVLGYHTQINIPTLVVAHNLTVKLLEGESCDIVSQLVLRKYLGWHFDSIMLVFNDAHNHTPKYQIGYAGVGIRRS